MKDRKIFKALTFLSVYEMNSFRKYLLSPFFNSNQACIDLFDIIDKTIREVKVTEEKSDYEKNEAHIRFDEDKFDEISNEYIWGKIYGKTPYVDIKLRKLFSELFDHFENFLTQKELEKDQDQYFYLKLKAVKDRNMKMLYSSVTKEALRTRNIRKNKSSEFYLNQFNEQKIIQEFNLQSDIISRKSDLNQKFNIEEASINLDVFFISEKLKYYCNILAWNRSFHIKQKIIGIDIILKLAQSPIFKDYPPVAIYHTISLTITDADNENHYYKLIKLIDKHLYLFNREEAKEIMESALGYAVTKANSGVQKFDRESFELYKNYIDEDLLLLSDGTLSPREFRNVVFYAIKNNEIIWAEKFIVDYSPYISKEFRESNVSFSLARLEMFKKNYSKVIGHLVNTEYTEVFEALLSRTLLLSAYYELQEEESLSFLFNSFKLYLDRERSLTNQRKKPYYNLIKFTRSLVRLNKNDKKKIQKLKEEVLESDSVVSKGWLLEKIDQKLGLSPNK